MDNQNNINNNQNNVNINQQTTNLPTSNIVNNTTNIQENTTNNVVNNTANVQNENNKQENGGCFKSFLAFVFLIGMILFVVFLPNITEFIESKKTKTDNTKENTVTTGTLICNKKNVKNDDDISYEMKMTFRDKKIINSKLTTEVQSYDTQALVEKKTKCDAVSNIAKSIDGLETECRLNDTVYTVIEQYELSKIDTSKITSYTEAGGTYPQFSYGKDIYDIKTTLVKEGYDCDISSTIRED